VFRRARAPRGHLVNHHRRWLNTAWTVGDEKRIVNLDFIPVLSSPCKANMVDALDFENIQPFSHWVFVANVLRFQAG